MLDVTVLRTISGSKKDGIMIPYYCAPRNIGDPKKFISLKIDGIPVGATFATNRNLTTRVHKSWNHTYRCIVIPFDMIRTMRIEFTSFDLFDEVRFLGKGLSLLKKVVAQYVL